jgi:hypothetical protein
MRLTSGLSLWGEKTEAKEAIVEGEERNLGWRKVLEGSVEPSFSYEEEKPRGVEMGYQQGEIQILSAG